MRVLMSRRPGGAGRPPPWHRCGRRCAAVQPGQAALALRVAWMVGWLPLLGCSPAPLILPPFPRAAPAVPPSLVPHCPLGLPKHMRPGPFAPQGQVRCASRGAAVCWRGGQSGQQRRWPAACRPAGGCARMPAPRPVPPALPTVVTSSPALLPTRTPACVRSGSPSDQGKLDGAAGGWLVRQGGERGHPGGMAVDTQSSLSQCMWPLQRATVPGTQAAGRASCRRPPRRRGSDAHRQPLPLPALCPTPTCSAIPARQRRRAYWRLVRLPSCYQLLSGKLPSSFGWPRNAAASAPSMCLGSSRCGPQACGHARHATTCPSVQRCRLCLGQFHAG